MNKLILAVSAAALLCGVAPVAAQSSGSSAGGAGMLCSDLTAMDSASQTAFLKGYKAGQQDAMSGASGDTAAASGGATGAAGGSTMGATGGSTSGGSTDTAAAGSTTGSTGSGASGSTDATATGSTTTASSGSTAGGSAAGAAGGATDFNKILTACASSPSTPISSAMSGMGTSP